MTEVDDMSDWDYRPVVTSNSLTPGHVTIPSGAPTLVSPGRT
ncbi:MAG TPA: hypothetical protein VN408_09540 [Actinoplanes sp.]|nr:hypothetical protein [Actinoplanes sp.]